MMNLQVEPATERTILNRLKQTKFSPPTATRPTLAPSDTPVSKKNPIFDFHARKIYVIVFALMVTEEMFFYTFIIYYTFMILH